MNNTETFSSMTPCSCGCKEPHIVAERQMIDGVTVCLWSDGDVTGRLGIYPPGLGKIRRSSNRALRAGWLVMGEVCLYEWAELARLVKIARKACEQICLTSDSYVRRKMAGESFWYDGGAVVKVRA